MKFSFAAEDSLYKIFKTLERIPKGKNVEIAIDSHHSLFDNERRGRQIKEVLDKRNINAIFITKTDKDRVFFSKIGLKINHLDKNKFLKILRMIYLFVFDIKKFHLNTLQKKRSYTFFLVFGFEIVFVIFVLYLLYSLILPGARIEISPSQQIETIIYNFRYYPITDQDYPRYSRFISIPFYTGNFNYRYDMSIDTMNIRYLQDPSYGDVKIFNKTNKSYTFVPNTRFVTDDGKLYQTNNRVEVPAGYDGVPGEKIIRIKAMDKDENGILMGNRGNITRGTNLYIKNLKQSLFLKEIYAVVMDDFTGGNLVSEGIITQEDINLLSDKLATYISQQKKNIAKQNFNIKDSLLLAFDNTISSTIKNIEIPYNTGDKTAILDGYINVNISFLYVKWDDLIKSFSNYIVQRPSDKNQLVNINKNSLEFFQEDSILERDGTFIVPTKIDIIQGYDFNKDVDDIINDIKSHIVGNSREVARSYILSFPQVSSAKIKITPAWYDSIPKLKSRIKINLQD